MEIIESSKTIENGWEKVIKDAEPELKHISKLLDQQKKLGVYFPKGPDIFNSFKYCPFSKVKVIIIGNNPYPGSIEHEGNIISKDMGMSYGLRKCDTLSKSMQNIYTELKNTVKGFEPPSHGNLESWAEQGILMINNSLVTTNQKVNFDYSELWYGFLNKVFKSIGTINPNTIVVLWGRKIQQISKLLPDGFVLIESDNHPEEYRANVGFLGCNHFNIINEHLKKQKRELIDWTI